MKKRITVRFSDDEIEFIEEMKKKGINPSNFIRFCVIIVKIILHDEEVLRKLIKKLYGKDSI